MRKTTLAAGGVALALALAACGGGDDSANGGNPLPSGGSGLFSNVEQLVANASAKTEESQSAKFTMEMTMMGQQMTAQGEGVFAGGDSKMSMTMDAQGQTIEMRFLDNTMYMKMPEELTAQAGGKPWVKISPDGDDPLSQAMGNMDQTAEQSDPRKILDQIKQAGEITKSEETTLDGQDVTHYWIEIDLAKASDMAGLPEDQAQQMAEKMGKLPMELWLNSDNLPVQITMDMGKVMESAGMSGQGGEMVMKYSDWGAPVNIEAPPADQIGEMPGA